MSLRRILIIDDDPAFGAFVAKAISKLEFEILQITDAGTFRRHLDEWKPDVVIVDLKMVLRPGTQAQNCSASRAAPGEIWVQSDPFIIGGVSRGGNRHWSGCIHQDRIGAGPLDIPGPVHDRDNYLVGSAAGLVVSAADRGIGGLY